jgi:hypothetical protein
MPFLLLLCLVAFAFAENSGIEKFPFFKGERLDYVISWGIITAGNASLEIKSLENDKTEFYVLAHNNGAFKSIYPVADTIYSRIRNKNFLPEVFKKINHEGKYHASSVIRFDRVGEKAWLSDSVFTDFERKQKKRSADTVITISGKELDIISAFYFVRQQAELKQGKTESFSAVSGKKKYELKVVVYGKEQVKTKAGTFECIKIEPILDGDGIFKAAGRLFIWLTDDNRRLPVLMKSKIALGSIKAELVRFSQKKE